MSIKSVKQLAGQTVVYGLGTILPRFLNYLLTPLYTYLFVNPADYGINAEIYAYISFLNILFLYGMETAFFHFANKTDQIEKVFRNATSLILITTLVLSALLILLSDKITNILHYESALFIYWTIGILATDTLMAIPYTYLRQNNRAFQFSVLKVLNVLLNIGFNCFFFLLCKVEFDSGQSNFFSKLYNPTIGIGYSFLSNLLANGCSLFMLYPVWKKFKFELDSVLIKKMLVYALPLLIVGLAGMVNETFDRIILKYLLPADKAQAAQGIYGACYKISILMTIFIQAYRYAAEPFLFKAFKNEDSKHIYALTTEFFTVFGCLIWLLTLLNLPILQYFIGPSYRVGLNVVPILISANLCLGVYFNLSFWYKLTGQTKIGAYITILGALVTLLINFIFVPYYSYVASAWATLSAYFLMMIISYFLGQKYYPIQYPVLKVISIFIFSFLIYYLSISIHFSDKLHQLLFNNGLLIVFLAALFFIYKPIFLKNEK